MNLEVEKIFCDTFLDKRIRDRIFFELSTPTRRDDALYRFSSCEAIIKFSTIVVQGKKLLQEDLLKEVRKFSNSKTGYIIAPYEVDGKEFPLEEAIDKFFYLGFGAVVVVDSKTAIAKGEQEFGPSCKYVLHV